MKAKNHSCNFGRYFGDVHKDGTKYINIVNKKMFGRHK